MRTSDPATWHDTLSPSILYLGTPVALLSTVNPDGSANLAPMSSCWFLGWRAMLGMGTGSQTVQNLRRERQVVINLPSAEQVDAVDRLALTTGADPVPTYKQDWGYEHVADKFGRAGLTEVPSHTVAPPRAAQCPVALEGVVAAMHGVAEDDDEERGGTAAIEVRVTRVHAHPRLRVPGSPHRIDPDRWRPLIMSFQHFYGLGEQVHPPRLASIPEENYRGADAERAAASLDAANPVSA